jgi:hypothetical protein
LQIIKGLTANSEAGKNGSLITETPGGGLREPEFGANLFKIGRNIKINPGEL